MFMHRCPKCIDHFEKGLIQSVAPALILSADWLISHTLLLQVLVIKNSIDSQRKWADTAIELLMKMLSTPLFDLAYKSRRRISLIHNFRSYNSINKSTVTHENDRRNKSFIKFRAVYFPKE